MDFLWEAPPCPTIQCMLDLPKRSSPIAENVVAIREGVSGETARWRLEAGGRNRFPLRIVPSKDLDSNHKVNRVRQATTYDVSLSGVNIWSQMTLDIPDVPIRRMAIELDPGVRLISAHCGETSLGWIECAPLGQGQQPSAVLEFPEPVRGTGGLFASARWPPRRSAAFGVCPSSNRGRCSGKTAPRRSKFPRRCWWSTWRRTARQVRVGPLMPPHVGESLEFQCFSPDAHIDLLLARPLAPLQITSATAVELANAEMLGDMTAVARIAEGEQFQGDCRGQTAVGH